MIAHNTTTPRHPNAILTLEVPYILTVVTTAITTAEQISLRSNVEITLPANTQISFGAVTVILRREAVLGKTAVSVRCFPLPADLTAGSRSDQPLPNGDRPRHVLTTQIKAWLVESSSRRFNPGEALESGQTVLRGRALEPIPEQFKPCQSALVRWLNGDADRGLLKFYPAPRSFLRVERHLGGRIQGVFSAEVPVVR